MNKFPWNCGECPMLHTYDLSIDDLTHICLWSKSQIDDCDRHKSAECPMEKHDEEIRADERAKTIDECKEILYEAVAIAAKTKCHIYMVALNKMEQLKSHK